jgi:hypothetical protein
MNRIVDFYESNHLLIFAFFIIVTIVVIYNNNNKIKELIIQVGKMKLKISEFETIKFERISKTIKIGSLVRLKYVLTGEIRNIIISENENNKLKNNSDIIRINYKSPLGIALLNMQESDIIKFKKSQLAEEEIYVVILDVNNGFDTNAEIVIIENNDLEIQNNSENIEKTVMNSKENIKQDHLNREELFLSYFILDENWFGQNKSITVTFNEGNYKGRIFKYEHDEVYILTIAHFQKLDCWRDYGRFSNSRNIPEIVQPFVTVI